MPRTTTTAPTVAELAARYGRPLAYIASRDDGTVPDDPTTVDLDGLLDLVNGAATFMSAAHHDPEMDELENAATFLAAAASAEPADQGALLKQAESHLRGTDEMAEELADELGETYPG